MKGLHSRAPKAAAVEKSSLKQRPTPKSKISPGNLFNVLVSNRYYPSQRHTDTKELGLKASTLSHASSQALRRNTSTYTRILGVRAHQPKPWDLQKSDLGSNGCNGDH